MKLKEHLNRWALMLAVLTLVCTATGKLLFASADNKTFVGPVYSDVTPVSSRAFVNYAFQSVTPTSTARYLVQSVTPVSSSAVTLSYTNRFVDEERPAIVVQSVTPVATSAIQVLSVSEPEPECEVIPTQVYTDYLPVILTVGNTVEDDSILDGFIYSVTFLGSSGEYDISPDMPVDKTVALAGNDIASFDAIYFREPGQYYFKVAQDQINSALNTDKGYEWNDTWYFVGVHVEEGDWGLESTVNYYEVSDGGNCIPRSSLATFTQLRK